MHRIMMFYNFEQNIQGPHLTLEPLSVTHFEFLYKSAQDPSIWEFIPTSGMGKGFDAWYEAAMQAKNLGEQFPYLVRRTKDQQILGSTRFYDIDSNHARLSIGYTWYIPEVWGSTVNPECKYLLLQYAFETLNVNRVQLKTDIRNKHSQAAIKKLGAKEEGVLRHHMKLPDGTLRDTIIFSIIKPEWPKVKTALDLRLASKD